MILVAHRPVWQALALSTAWYALSWVASRVQAHSIKRRVRRYRAAKRKSITERAVRSKSGWPSENLLARGLTSLATRIAGPSRPALRDEWQVHLAGESGHDPV